MTHKITPITLLLLPLFVCLLSGCSTLYHDYLFAEKDAKSLTRSIKPHRMPEKDFNHLYYLFIDRSRTNFRIEFDTRYNEEEDAYAGEYEFSIVIYPAGYNFIETIYINDVTIYAGDTSYSMKDKIRYIDTFHDAAHLLDIRWRDDELLDINSSGIIHLTDTYQAEYRVISYD